MSFTWCTENDCSPLADAGYIARLQGHWGGEGEGRPATSGDYLQTPRIFMKFPVRDGQDGDHPAIFHRRRSDQLPAYNLEISNAQSVATTL